MRRVCVFCGSNPGLDARYGEGARAFAAALVRRGLGVVYGGGRIGMMGIVADTVLELGGDVVGVIPVQLARREVAHASLSELHVVDSMHERKARMFELSDAFVALPGGIGTFEELFEVLTWSQLGVHDRPVGVLDVAGYWQPLLALLDAAVTAGFVRSADRDLLLAERDGETLLDRFERWRPPPRPHWIEPTAT